MNQNEQFKAEFHSIIAECSWVNRKVGLCTLYPRLISESAAVHDALVTSTARSSLGKKVTTATLRGVKEPYLKTKTTKV